MLTFLTKGLTKTAVLWLDVEQGYAWVHRAAHLLSNDEELKAPVVRQRYEMLLAEMGQAPPSSELLTTMLSIFHKVTASYWPGLFHCYDQADLSRINHEVPQRCPHQPSWRRWKSPQQSGEGHRPHKFPSLVGLYLTSFLEFFSSLHSLYQFANSHFNYF